MQNYPIPKLPLPFELETKPVLKKRILANRAMGSDRQKRRRFNLIFETPQFEDKNPLFGGEYGIRTHAPLSRRQFSKLLL